MVSRDARKQHPCLAQSKRLQWARRETHRNLIARCYMPSSFWKSLTTRTRTPISTCSTNLFSNGPQTLHASLSLEHPNIIFKLYSPPSVRPTSIILKCVQENVHGRKLLWVSLGLVLLLAPELQGGEWLPHDEHFGSLILAPRVTYGISAESRLKKAQQTGSIGVSSEAHYPTGTITLSTQERSSVNS